MALYLDNQTRPYLERKFKEVGETDFIGKRIQEMLKADRERIEAIGDCDHEEGKYYGEKTCCVKCGGVWIPGQGESWSLPEALPNSNGSGVGQSPDAIRDLKREGGLK